MPKFIELSRKKGGCVSVNVDRLVSFEEAHTSEGDFCVISLDGFSLFVKETYSEVESMVRKDVEQMTEIIVEADRELYTDDEWRDIASERIVRCWECKFQRDCYCDHPKGVYMNAILPVELDGFCKWGEPKVVE